MEELRSFLVRYHFLDNHKRLAGKAGIKKVFQKLGSVQYDVLNVVGRNPDLVLQSRVSGYTSDLLYDLLYGERWLIDGWDKEMSIYPVSDWSGFERVRQCRKESALGTLKYRGQEEVLSYLPQIKKEIENRGPLAARDLKLGATQANRWGHRQISGAAMDYLYLSGELGIHSKKNAQKTYDLIENLVPEKLLKAPKPFAIDEEFLEWYYQRRIGSLGACWLRNGPGWLGYFLSDPALRKKTLRSLEDKKLIVPFYVPEINETVFIQRKALSVLSSQDQYDGAARFLAPLDNMLWDRLFVQKVFDFQYTWEVYVPQTKRKYGYYVLPVLYQNKFIARLEPVKHNKGRPFAVKNWWWESSYENCASKIKREIKEAVTMGLENFARYLEADGADKKFLNAKSM